MSPAGTPPATPPSVPIPLAPVATDPYGVRAPKWPLVAQLPPVFDALAVGVVVHSRDGKVLAGNAEAKALLAGVPVSVLRHAVAQLDEPHTSRSFTLATVHPDGTPRRLLMTLRLGLDSDGQTQLVVTTVRDVKVPLPRSASETSTSPELLRCTLDLTERRLATLTDNSPIGIAIITADGTILQINRALARMTDQATFDLRGTDIAALIHPGDRDAHARLLARLSAGELGSYELEVRLDNGLAQSTWARLSASAVYAPNGALDHVTLQAQDTTEARTALARLTYQAVHDPLTGLPNRALCGERIRHLLASALRTGRRTAALLFDLDHFRVVNDSVGPAHGDHVLVVVAQRLREALNKGVIVARLSGDEFVVAAEVSDAREAIALARHVIGTIGQPVELAGRTVVPSVSVGVAISAPPIQEPMIDTADPWRLIQEAGAALHQAKRTGRGSVVVSDEMLRNTTHDRLALESQLRAGVAHGQMRLHLQDIVDLRDGSVVGREALVRWQHPERGLLPPGLFLPVAEDSGLIQDLGRWVIHEAARIARLTSGHGYVAINVSPSQVRHPGLSEQIEAALDAVELPPDQLVVELTESVMLDAATQARDQLQRLDDLGVRIVVDDFGTGFSALSHLRDLPVSGIKIDRSFTQGLGVDRHCDRIVEALTGLADGLGVDLVAEGVETEEQAELLTRIGCQHAQGFLFGKPRPVAQPDLTN